MNELNILFLNLRVRRKESQKKSRRRRQSSLAGCHEKGYSLFSTSESVTGVFRRPNCHSISHVSNIIIWDFSWMEFNQILLTLPDRNDLVCSTIDIYCTPNYSHSHAHIEYIRFDTKLSFHIMNIATMCLLLICDTRPISHSDSLELELSQSDKTK